MVTGYRIGIIGSAGLSKKDARRPIDCMGQLSRDGISTGLRTGLSEGLGAKGTPSNAGDLHLLSHHPCRLRAIGNGPGKTPESKGFSRTKDAILANIHKHIRTTLTKNYQTKGPKDASDTI